MNYQKIYKNTISDGSGIGVSLYVSGCTLHCKGCHNAAAWDFASGTPYTADTETEILEALAKPYVNHLSILGGEPMDQDQEALVSLVEKVKQLYPEKDIWCWTGYEFEDIRNHSLTKYLDIIVCGRYIDDQRDISGKNPFRGSRNQRVIDVQASLNSDRTIPLAGIPNNII
jgi:anaerobic ribonucleoside-triphosphate reductase activating protein